MTETGGGIRQKSVRFSEDEKQTEILLPDLRFSGIIKAQTEQR